MLVKIYTLSKHIGRLQPNKTKNNEQMQSQKWFHFGELWTL